MNQISRSKKWIFSLATFFVPILFLVFLEFGLRIVGYGVDVSLFKRHVVWGQVYYQMNPGVTYRYFATSFFRPSTDPIFFKVPKPKGVYRIFCLGESTSAGFPYWYNGAFPAYLLTRLRSIFPDKRIEMINLSLTATNSYTALDLARELPKYQPNLVIYYGGHNEFYGALGVGSNQSVSTFRLVTEVYLELIHLRTFQLLQNIIHGVATSIGLENNSLSRGTEMEQVARGRLIPYGGRLYKAAYSIFKQNLEDIRTVFTSRQIPIIMGTQVSDLRDQSPFVSGHSPGLSAARKAEFDRQYQYGIQLQAANNWDSAEVEFESAINIDSLYADAHYRLAQCLDTTGHKLKAFHQYILARNYDELRFRTDTQFNNVIRSMADGKYCFVADVVKAFEAASPDSLIGHNLIWEHLHPNSRGAFLIAKCYANVMEAHGLLAPTTQWIASDTVSDSELWNKRAVTTIDERMAEYSVKWLTSGWPFKDENPHLTTVSPKDTLNWIAEEVIAGRVSWVQAHFLAVNYYLNRNNLAEVADIYRSLLSVSPLDLNLHNELANVYLRENEFQNAARVMLQSISIHPTFGSFMNLGDIMMRQSDPDSAIGFYQKGYSFARSPEERLRGEMAMSYSYARAGNYSAARSAVLDILQEFPHFQPAKVFLQDINGIIAQAGKRK